MSKPLRAGLIGCGGVAGAHMRAYRQLEGLEVAAAKGFSYLVWQRQKSLSWPNFLVCT